MEEIREEGVASRNGGPVGSGSRDFASVEATAALTPKRAKATYIGAPACFALESACQDINRAFGGFGCYLVGSALERPDWRDVDVRLIMDDEEFDAEFPHTMKNGTWEFDPKWILLTVAISERLSKLTGLPVDFQFQPQTHANKVHKGRRNALGMRFKRPDPEHERILAIGALVDERLDEMTEKTGLEGDECQEFVVLSDIVAKVAALQQEDNSHG
ncbi:hypothetical protein [Caulobacter sp. FWC2]|uniref:hypothetical protein n=1 Tax=Caulobacter sp. FWC2 TaxID=69664 RepID=UPI0018EA421E|nr:hypothetical protein [Caulobacter sp. FWC2]